MIKGLELLQTEEGFRARMDHEIIPYLKGIMTKEYFDSYDGTKIAWRRYRNTTAAANVLIVHGFSEFIEKYNEMIYILLKNGFEV